MPIADVSIEATHPTSRRSSGRSPEAMTALAGRIRSLQRSEPQVTGAARTAALAELASVEVQLERLSLDTWRTGVDYKQQLANTLALTEHVDRLARLWPSDATADLAAILGPLCAPVAFDRQTIAEDDRVGAQRH